MAEWKDCSQSASMGELDFDLDYFSCNDHEDLHGNVPLPGTEDGTCLRKSGLDGIATSSTEPVYKEQDIRSRLDPLEPKRARSATSTRDLLKRRNQNRASQRTYRQRRRHSRDLEAKVQELMSSSNPENFEDNHAESKAKRTKIAIGYYRHLLETKRTTVEDLSSMPKSCVMPNFPNNVPYIGTPMSPEFSDADADNHMTEAQGSDWYFLGPVQTYTSIYPEQSTSHGYASHYTTPVQISEPLYSPSQRPVDSVNMDSAKTLTPVFARFQEMGGVIAGSDDETWGLDIGGWAKDDNLSVPLQAQVYLQDSRATGEWNM